MSDILCITNRSLCKENFLDRVEKIASAKPAGIILREKDLEPSAYQVLAEQVIAICQKHGTACILHSFPAVALALQWKSIHLPLPVLRNLSVAERSFFSVLGASCHSVEEAKEAEALGCTYITAGHIFNTDCKKDLPGRGIAFLQELCENVTIPVYGIGGIDTGNMNQVRKTGAAGGCVMSSVMVCEDVQRYLTVLEERKMQFRKEMLLLYAVTDRTWVGKQTLYEQIEEALKGGVTMVQLREKTLGYEAFVQEAKAIKALCARYAVPLIINDNVEVALAAGADGVHVGVEDAPVAEIRARVGADFIIGATCKTVAQAQAAEKAGADYMGVGAVFPSSTKKNAIRITTEQLKTICSSVSIPAVAIGGISLDNVSEIAGGGMAGIAVVSAIFAAENIQKTTAALKQKVKTVVVQRGENDENSIINRR